MSNERRFLIILFNLFYVGGSCQSLNLNGLEKLPAKEYFDKKVEKRNGIKRTDKKKVTIMFLQDFSDTILVYKDSVLLMNKYVWHDSTIVSTDYTGENLTHQYSSGKSLITIIYKNQKKYLQFRMKREFPLYAIYVLLQNGLYAISARKNKMIIE